jgi:biotin carboxylase
MRVVVTNTHTPQAYAIVRALRPGATRIVALTEGRDLRARLAHVTHSRLVDATCQVPSLVDDWASGRLAAENTPAEAAWVDAVSDVCRRERIDVLFPSWDPYVAVCAKNRAHFATMGVTVPVPDFGTTILALDKQRTLDAAREAGVPCPRTYLYAGRDSLAAIADQEPFPLVIKPRFTSGSRGMAIVGSRAELLAGASAVAERFGPPLVQEYIPGGDRTSLQLVVDRDGAVVFAFHKRRHRTFKRTARLATVSESASPDERLHLLASLPKRLGWWGAMGIETIRDPRDGRHKLMEVNPRFPRQLWNRTEMGVNEPLMCVRIARGEPVAPVPPYPTGLFFVSPVEDAQLFALQVIDWAARRARAGLFGQALFDPALPRPTLRAEWASFSATYRRGVRRVWDPYSRYFFQDPVASMLWWLQFSSWIAGAVRQVGR